MKLKLKFDVVCAAHGGTSRLEFWPCPRFPSIKRLSYMPCIFLEVNTVVGELEFLVVNSYANAQLIAHSGCYVQPEDISRDDTIKQRPTCSAQT